MWLLEIFKGTVQRPLAMSFGQPAVFPRAAPARRCWFGRPAPRPALASPWKAKGQGAVVVSVLGSSWPDPSIPKHGLTCTRPLAVSGDAGGAGSPRHVARAPLGARCGLVKVGGLGSLSSLDN